MFAHINGELYRSYSGSREEDRMERQEIDGEIDRYAKATSLWRDFEDIVQNDVFCMQKRRTG